MPSGASSSSATKQTSVKRKENPRWNLSKYEEGSVNLDSVDYELNIFIGLDKLKNSKGGGTSKRSEETNQKIDVEIGGYDDTSMVQKH